VKNFLIKLLVY